MTGATAISDGRRKRLQRLIDNTTRACNDFHKAQAALNEWCIESYGVEPGDINADEIIDAVLGGSGTAPGMLAEDFHEIMAGSSNV